MFTLGMTISSMQFIFLNTTTIENLSRHSKVWSLAILMPSTPPQPTAPPFNTITYPLGYIYPNQDDSQARPTPPQVQPRRFAILHSRPGDNIWDLGYWRNFQSVMGIDWYDWLLPIKYSPCCYHSSEESHFEMGRVVDSIRENAGLTAPDNLKARDGKRRHRSRPRSPVIGEKPARRSRRKRERIKGGGTGPNGKVTTVIR